MTAVESAYAVSQEVEDIQREILSHGPVEAGFLVYEDFLSYESGKSLGMLGQVFRYGGREMSVSISVLKVDNTLILTLIISKIFDTEGER